MMWLVSYGIIYVGVLIWYALWWYRKPTVRSSETPSVSVVIPARNEADNVVHLLRDLHQQEYAGTIEVLVIDDYSTDNTAAVAAPLAHRVIMAADAGIPYDHLSPKKAALAAGIAVATGDWIVTLDADIRVGPHHIAGLMKHALSDTVMIAGSVAFGAGRGLLHHFQQFDMLGMQLFTGAAIHWSRPFLCNGANLAFRKDAFDRVKGYAGIDTIASGDDVLLLSKLANAFGSEAIAYAGAEETVAVTRAQPSWKDLLHQRIRWASKVSQIKLAPAIWLGLVVFFFYLYLLAELVYALVIWEWNWAVAAVLVAKWITEAFLVGKVAHDLRQPVAWAWLVPSQLLYLVYVPAAAILGKFTGYQWKGRQLR